MNRHISTLYLNNKTYLLNKLLQIIQWDTLAIGQLTIECKTRLVDVGFLSRLQNLRSLKLLASGYRDLKGLELRNLEDLEIFLTDQYDYPIVEYRLQCWQLK